MVQGGGGEGGGDGTIHRNDPLLQHLGVACLSLPQIVAVVERRV